MLGLMATVWWPSPATERASAPWRRRSPDPAPRGAGQLSAGIAHDFNNLLAAILGYAGMLRDAVDGDDAAARDIDEIVAAADRGAALVRQLVAQPQADQRGPRSLTSTRW
ncbi:MAG: histidine kinase dimerization/phospho-acceptor domain-containing protein [Chloroflexota bacterium]